MTVHVAKVTDPHWLPDDAEVQWFASLDGEEWLPVNQEPTQDDEDDVAELFEPQHRDDGRGFQYLRFARRYLQHMGAEFV